MSFTNTITHRNSYNDGYSAISTEFVDPQTAGEEHNISESVPDGSTDLLVAYSYDFSQGKTFVMWSTVAMTVKTNNSGAPDQTFSLAANTPIAWSAGQVSITNPITVDITALYATNASGSDGILNIRSLQDPTV